MIVLFLAIDEGSGNVYGAVRCAWTENTCGMIVADFRGRTVVIQEKRVAV